MGSIASRIAAIFQPRRYRVILAGSHLSGKTTILHKIKYRDSVPNMPQHLGFWVELFHFGRMEVTVFQVSDSPQIRMMLKPIFQGTEGLIFVVDLSNDDPQQIQRVVSWYHYFKDHKQLDRKPVLILANKNDIARIPLSLIEQKLNLKAEGTLCRIQPCQAINEQGLTKGLEWLDSVLTRQQQMSNQ